MQHEEALSLLKLADRDWEILQVIKGAERVHLSGVAFHAQQLVEKTLKAILSVQQLPFDRTHDLIRLARTIEEYGLTLPVSLDELGKLNPYAVVFRYDDTDIEIITRDEAAKLAQMIKEWATQVVMTQIQTQREQP
jgi:HEPN domain-containing protein